MASADEILFPYMAWAKACAGRSRWCLSQSGMPPPDAALLADVAAVDLASPQADALPRFEARIAELFDASPDRVLATLAASGAMQIAASRLFGSGATVVTETPSYDPLRALPRFLGARSLVLERRLEDGWTIDPERVRELLAGAGGPAHVFLTNPHNPSGAVLDAGTVRAIARAAEEAGGVLVSNETYMEFAPPPERVHAFALAPNAVSIGTLTKAYGLGALRLGWILLGEELASRRAWFEDAVHLSYVHPPTPSLRIGLAALERLPDLLRPLRRFEVECRPHLVRFLHETPGVRAHVPPFGLTTFPRIEDVGDTAALAAHLRETEEVEVVPGELFGGPGHLRISATAPEATLAEGLERLARGIASFRERTA